MSDAAQTDEDSLDEDEKEAVHDSRSLNAISVYAVIYGEGREEMERPASSLWWSGVAAGIGISSSVLAEGILHATFEGYRAQVAIENFGYTIGFILVILGRMQLFTENTLTVVLPVLSDPSRKTIWCLTRLWAIVFAANMVGTLAASFLSIFGGTVTPEHLEGMLAISRHYGELEPWDAFTLGIPAGFFVASIVWMLPSSRQFAVFVIMLFTYLIAMGDFTHVVAGSTELWLLLLNGEMGPGHALLLLFSTLAGNVLGGTAVFALLAYGQVAEEIHPEGAEGPAERGPR